MNQRGFTQILLLVLTLFALGWATVLYLGYAGVIKLPYLSSRSSDETKVTAVDREIDTKKEEASKETIEKLGAFKLVEVVPAVVQLQCYFNGENEPQQTGSGSSFYSADKTQHWIYTNAHVVRNSDGILADGCYVYFPDQNGGFYKSVYWAGIVIPYDDKKAAIEGVEVGGANVYEGGFDYAYLTITERGNDGSGIVYPFPTKFPDLFSISQKTCEDGRQIELGEKLYILGYPRIGGSTMTITEGIVSGFEGDFDEWIKTSSTIASGNSGGLAILAKDGCLLGIPTAVTSEEGSSLGSILRFNFIDKFTENLIQ